MTLVSSAIPNLVNGVSQQPYIQRLITQAEKQVNGYSSLVEGLRKRQPSVHVAKLLSTPMSTAFIHTINRSSDEQYVVMFPGNGSIQVWDIDGNQKTVNALSSDAAAYVTTTAPATDLVATTVADYTFVANKTKVVANDGSTVPTQPHTALVWVRSGNYATSYVLSVNGTTATYNTPEAFTDPSGGAATSSPGIATLFICDILQSLLATGTTTAADAAISALVAFGASVTVTGPALTAPFAISIVGSSILIQNGAADFTTSSTDGMGGTAMVLSKDVVQSFDNLPAQAVNGLTFQIEGEGNDGTNANYYVQYQANGGGTNDGVWVECPKPGENATLDATTMPYQLVRNADGTFTFSKATWSPRQCGDIATCPFPSFVGQTINSVFFYQDRLGFLAGENVVLSVTAQFFNFMRTSALQLLATDPIDIGSTSTMVSTLKAAVPFQGVLLLFADLQQFQLTFQNALTPQTVSILPATAYGSDLTAAPVGAGSNVYFAFDRGTFTGIREYYLDGAGRINEADDVTSNVPTYIPGSPVKLTVATNEGALVVQSSASASALYIYSYYWSQGSKLQASWSQWQFDPGDTILNVEFLQNDLYMVVSRPDGVYLEFINVQAGQLEVGQPFLVHLDRKVLSGSSFTSVTYDAVRNLSTVTLPYVPNDWTKVECISWVGSPTIDVGARPLPLSQVSANSFTVPGHLINYYVGISYEFRYRFSTFITREPVPMTYSMQAVTAGRLQIRNALVNYANTGYLRAEVTPQARDMSTYIAPIIKTGQILAGGIPLGTGTFTFPVTCQNTYAQIDLVNDSYLPCFLESAGWEGFFILRSRRI